MGSDANQAEIDLAGAGIPSEPASPIKHALYCVTGVGISILWTALGASLAFLQGEIQHFLGEWYSLQGLPLIALGTWLALVIRSKGLRKRVAALTESESLQSGTLMSPPIRLAIVAGIGSVGTASLIAMGFGAHGVVLAFMWITCAAVAFVAAMVTLHAIEMLLLVLRLEDARIKVFHYSPARTPELRDFVSYFTSFGLLLTFGYGFALLGTMSPYWTGNKDYVNAVRLFWPLLYVPTCSLALIYPHLLVHRLIRREKDRTLFSYQREIDGLLNKYGTLNTDEVERTNSLAQLFERINSTPNYVLDTGNVMRTILPLLFNVASLAAKVLIHQN